MLNVRYFNLGSQFKLVAQHVIMLTVSSMPLYNIQKHLINTLIIASDSPRNVNAIDKQSDH
jgi:hypothetical protein